MRSTVCAADMLIVFDNVVQSLGASSLKAPIITFKHFMDRDIY